MSLTSSRDSLTFTGVNKTFRTRPKQSLLWALAGRSPLRTVQALTDVSFAVAPGRALAVIGTNGAGKSTLLRLAVGASRPSDGRVARTGTVAPVLELGAGFHPALSGRENALVNARLLGLSRREAHAALDEILAFAEIEDAADAPVSDYSAGMLLRLGFAVAVQTRPSLLVVDEVLAVGDLGFQLKCLARVREMRNGGTALLFASHVLSTVREVADEVLWLERGRVVAHGATIEVASAYERSSASSGAVTPGAVRVGGSDSASRSVRPGDRLSVEVTIEALRDLPDTAVEFRLRRLDLGVLAAWSGEDLRLPALRRASARRVVTAFDMAVADGRHVLDLAVVDLETQQVLHEEPAVRVFEVAARAAGRGIVDVSPESGVWDLDA